MGKAFVVYIGSHGDAGAHRADVILPGAAYTEKSATYVNTEGRVQVTTAKAVFPPGDARRTGPSSAQLSTLIGRPLPFNSRSQPCGPWSSRVSASRALSTDRQASRDRQPRAQLGAKGETFGTEPFSFAR
jgi:NADH dehydrogenase/NADH:ubiquinone oxidoreductase subunit G